MIANDDELDHEKAAGMTDGTTDLQALAAEAYIYGYPMVLNLDEVDRASRKGIGSVPPAPFNEFSHGGKPADPQDQSAGADADDGTVCSLAQLDLSGGALLLTVPDTEGRYYVLQFVDAWTNNFAYVGRRATGTGEASYLLTPPGWDEEVPLGATRIAVPTEVATIVGRWACTGPDDVAAVRALQEDTLLEPYWTASGELHGLPTHTYVPDGEPEILFYEKLRARMAAFPPAQPDLAYQQRFAPLGLLDAQSPYAPPEPELAEALRAGFAAGKEQVEQAPAPGAGTQQNGWRLTYHSFDYNADHFEVGTLKDPQWVCADREMGRMLRATSAHTALWGKHGYEAAYAQAWDDGDGRPLEGAQSYTLRFEKPPPVDAFWSVTMYGLPDPGPKPDPDRHLVADPAERHSIGDRTPGLNYDDDGSLTLLLQPQRPADDKTAANWLPTPEGRFRPVLRMYTPRAAIFDGTYELPPIRRA
ncbi:DUF1254 domain-containing protein [Streptomyces sp. NPDC050147]|uniref:DUF1254 domain-containing protein n=1 Tax=Streptomyces sp. NPDC050147 TaxID=3155513 RepID=UPI003444DA08